MRVSWVQFPQLASTTIGQENKDTIKAARAKAQLIDSDITFDRFDYSHLSNFFHRQVNIFEVNVSFTPNASIRSHNGKIDGSRKYPEKQQ